MNKIQQTIYITATEIDVEPENKKLIVVNGEFYFQGKKYIIANKEIKGF